MPMIQSRFALLVLLLAGCQQAEAQETDSTSSAVESYDSSVVGKLQQLADLEEIRQLKARYFRCMDQKDWGCFRATLHDDIDFNVCGALYACKDPAVIDVDAQCQEAWPSGTMSFTPAQIGQFCAAFQANGGDVVAGFEQYFLSGGQTMHQGHMPEISLTSPTTAKGIWTLTHHLRFRPELQYPEVPFFPSTPGQHELFGYGYYTEEYEKVPDLGWRIKKLRFTSFRVDLR
jgi:hypothetical protein